MMAHLKKKTISGVGGITKILNFHSLKGDGNVSKSTIRQLSSSFSKILYLILLKKHFVLQIHALALNLNFFRSTES